MTTLPIPRAERAGKKKLSRRQFSKACQEQLDVSNVDAIVRLSEVAPDSASRDALAELARRLNERKARYSK
jgi:hypothetical protein